MQHDLLWMGFLFFNMPSCGHTEGTPTLTADKTILPAGGSVTLTCTVDNSGHDIHWYRHDSELSAGQIMENTRDRFLKLSKGGLYSCRGGKRGNGNVISYTSYSNKVTIEETLPFKVTVTLDHNWPRIYGGETVTIRCEIQGGGQSNWTYECRKNQTIEKTGTSSEYRIIKAKQSDSGEYSCRGRRDRFSSTEWSDAVSLTVYEFVPVLSVSPSWLSPGASVTLSCEVEEPSARWRFFWYKAVPAPPVSPYNFKLLLPISINGTIDNSHIVHGQTSTAGYVCEARRGEQVVKSKPKFVWSADFQPGPSLKVNPERVQHFSSDSVSFHCEGNSTAWRLMRVTETGQHSRLNSSNWVTGQESIINNWSDGGIFWCETGLGEFSNAVNITLQNDYHDGVILVSPVHPVTEGDPVTLSCRDKKQNLLSNVFFYHNNKLINNDGREELKISAVSKSDEGFYKCQHSGKESPRSWMSVRVFLANVPSPVGSSSNVLLIIGPCSGILLIVLLFLCYYIRSKAPEEPGEVTYAQIEVKNFGNKRRPPKTEECAVYSEVKRGAADLIPVYADINHQNESKKRRKGEQRSAVFDVIYSEIKSVSILDNNATKQDVGCSE
ncbi:obscurin-like isoform X2 [Xiphophorus maculatus]|uniref:obscurin-like isoform X2 n=1 Tax=Xiphophorus maculatus TaxID=8083 RepID=UPI000C6C9699|nr:obscurin-like isoform X2 [Xiphophorus maculatus]